MGPHPRGLMGRPPAGAPPVTPNRSLGTTASPRRAAEIAAAVPAGPAPPTNTSHCIQTSVPAPKSART